MGVIGDVSVHVTSPSRKGSPEIEVLMIESGSKVVALVGARVSDSHYVWEQHLPGLNVGPTRSEFLPDPADFVRWGSDPQILDVDDVTGTRLEAVHDVLSDLPRWHSNWPDAPVSDTVAAAWASVGIRGAQHAAGMNWLGLGPRDLMGWRRAVGRDGAVVAWASFVGHPDCAERYVGLMSPAEAGDWCPRVHAQHDVRHLNPTTAYLLDQAGWEPAAAYAAASALAARGHMFSWTIGSPLLRSGDRELMSWARLPISPLAALTLLDAGIDSIRAAMLVANDSVDEDLLREGAGIYLLEEAKRRWLGPTPRGI